MKKKALLWLRSYKKRHTMEECQREEVVEQPLHKLTAVA